MTETADLQAIIDKLLADNARLQADLDNRPVDTVQEPNEHEHHERRDERLTP